MVEMTNDASDELVTHVLGFARTLRAAGPRIGPGQVLDALEAVRCAGIARREDFQAALAVALVHSPAERLLFEQAFHVHFRNPRLLDRLLTLLLPRLRANPPEDAQRLQRRLAEALFADGGPADVARESSTEHDAFLSASETEVLQRKDFAGMSAEELAEASRMLRQSVLPFAGVATRRYRRGALGTRVDMRATMQQARRHGGEMLTLVRERPRKRPPPLVLICDISGSMTRYSRMFLLFAHALTHARERVSTFVFGTRLTNVTPLLRHADPDLALDKLSGGVHDWAGGTRIGECLHAFNYEWSRRVLAQGGVVVLLSDGLEREPTPLLAAEMARLRRSCRQLIWLNPLLRYEGFEARAAGIVAMLPHVHALRPAHAVSNLLDLARAIDGRPQRRTIREYGAGLRTCA
jgi:uncharacterized protein with von Willebrand factor type A (vWA) domain